MAETLRAWQLIENPKRWTQGTLARDGFGDVAEVKWGARLCALGAMIRCYNTGNRKSEVFARIRSAYKSRFGADMSFDNDSLGMTAAVMSERLRVVEEEVLKVLNIKTKGQE